jgi:hypothetical protein
LSLCTYQFIAEGRAHRVWQKMANVIQDSVVSSAYQKIADDEKAHREFGRAGLENLAVTSEAQERTLKLADDMRLELYNVSCMNCVEVPAARDLVAQSYGSRFLKH